MNLLLFPVAFVFANFASLLDGNSFPDPVLLSPGFHRRHHHRVLVRNFFPVRLSNGSFTCLRFASRDFDVVLDLNVLPVLLSNFASDVFRLFFALVVCHFATDFFLLLHPFVDRNFTLRCFLFVLDATNRSLFGSPCRDENRSLHFLPLDGRLTGRLTLNLRTGSTGRCFAAISGLTLSIRCCEYRQSHK